MSASLVESLASGVRARGLSGGAINNGYSASGVLKFMSLPSTTGIVSHQVRNFEKQYVKRLVLHAAWPRSHNGWENSNRFPGTAHSKKHRSARTLWLGLVRIRLLSITIPWHWGSSVLVGAHGGIRKACRAKMPVYTAG